MLGYGPIHDVTASDLLENVNSNVVGPHNIFKAFSPLILESKASHRTIAVTSSLLSSIAAMSKWGPLTKEITHTETIPVACYAVSK